MATSSIFANVHITTPEGAEKFLRALELSEKDPPIPRPTDTVFMTREESAEMVRRWAEKQKQGAK